MCFFWFLYTQNDLRCIPFHPLLHMALRGALYNAWGVKPFLDFPCRYHSEKWQAHITDASFAQIENLTSLAIAELVNS